MSVSYEKPWNNEFHHSFNYEDKRKLSSLATPLHHHFFLTTWSLPIGQLYAQNSHCFLSWVQIDHTALRHAELKGAARLVWTTNRA
jgi:hypothetical protein